MTKIAMIMFQISKCGGITTVEKNLHKGLEENGHSVTHFFLTSNKKILPKESPFDFIDENLGYRSPEMLKTTISKLNEFDLIIYDPPCPTLTKSYDTRDWQQLYTDKSLPKDKLIITHDPYILSNYEWLLEVKDYITGVGAVQQKGYDPFLPYFGNILITNHYMDLSDIGDYSEMKENLVISNHQFKTWKHIDKFIESIPLINHNVEVYNGGIEYHYMSGKKRKEKYKNSNGEWIWDKALAHGMKYHGFVPDIITPFKRAKCIVDLSVGEHGSILSKTQDYKSLNYVPIEAMKYGAVPIVRRFSLLNDIITEDNVVLVDDNDLVKSTAKAVNHVIENFESYSDMIERNFKLVRKHFDRKTNAAKLLTLLTRKYEDPKPVVYKQRSLI